MTSGMGPYRTLEDHPGHRSTAVQTWYAQDSRSGEDVALTVVSPVPPEVAHPLVELAGSVRHPHVLPVLDLIVDGERVGLISTWPPGGRLSDLLERREPLTVGETLTVLRPLAAALAAIHRHGLVHGNVSAAVVWFDDSGRPLLGGLAAGLIAAQAIPAREALPQRVADLAPECARGAGPSVAADIFSLGSVALFCLTGRSAWPAEDPADVLVQSAGGVWPELPDDAAPPRLVLLVRRMLAADPAARPAAPSILADLQRCGVALPVDLAISGAVPLDLDVHPDEVALGDPNPVGAAADVLSGLPAVVLGPAPSGEPDPDELLTDEVRDPVPAAHRGSSLWGSSLWGSQRSGEVRTGPPIVRRRSDTGDRDRPGIDEGSAGERRRHGRQPGRRARRHDRREADPPGPGLPGSRRLAVVGLLAALIIVLGAVAKQAWSTDPDGVPPTAAADPAVDNADWLTVISALDAARAQALSSADPALLDRVYTTSSAQRAADAAVVTALAAKGYRVRDGTHQISSATVIPADASLPATAVPGGSDPAATGAPDSAVGTDGSAGGSPGNPIVQVAVVDALPAYPIVDQAGSTVGQTVARPEERRILVLAPTARGYRIDAILTG